MTRFPNFLKAFQCHWNKVLCYGETPNDEEPMAVLTTLVGVELNG